MYSERRRIKKRLIKKSSLYKDKLVKTKSLYQIGDLIECDTKARQHEGFCLGVIIRKYKRTKRFFDYDYFIATCCGVYKTPYVTIGKRKKMF